MNLKFLWTLSLSLTLTACGGGSGGDGGGNRAPAATAGSAQIVAEGVLVTLDASGSSDADGDGLEYAWAQLDGTIVTLSDAGAAQPTFTAPLVDENVELRFVVVVSDGEYEDSATVTITVNAAPVAAAGDDAVTSEGNLVMLDGGASTDPGDELGYTWEQLSGPDVFMAEPDGATLRFFAPDVGTITPLEFRLTVSDGTQETADNVVIEVRPVILEASVAGPKLLLFGWDDFADVHHLRLQENVDGVSGFSTVIDDIPASDIEVELEVATHLLDWANAEYLLEACLDDACTTAIAASTAQLADLLALEAIGYIKANATNVEDRFGNAVVLSGDGNTLAVGANFNDGVGLNSGSVYVFRQDEDGWRQQENLRPAEQDGGDQFGVSLSLSGDGNTLAVGAHGEDSNATGIDGSQLDDSASASGAAYVYRFDGVAGSWRLDAYVKAPNTHLSDFFGWRVALNGGGDILAVSAPSEDGDASSRPGAYNTGRAGAGAVYVYRHDADGWEFSDYLKAPNPDVNDKFGEGLAMDATGDVIVVGAMWEDGSAASVDGAYDDVAPDSGAAYVFRYDGVTWNQEAYLKAANADPDDRFGVEVDISGDGSTIAIASESEDGSGSGVNPADDNDAAVAGAIYAFRFNGTAWTADGYLKLTEMDAGDVLSNLALNFDGSLLAVGAIHEDGGSAGFDDPENDGALAGSGAAELLHRGADGWRSIRFIKAKNPGRLDTFGTSIAMNDSGDTLAISAQLEDGGSAGVNGDDNDDVQDAGAVYIY